MECALFPGYRGERYNLRMATPVFLAHNVWNRVQAWMIEKQIRLCAVWDAFAGIGVDAVIASKILNVCVFATEKDTHTYALLSGNIAHHRANVITRHADALKSTIRVDLIYLDPPWGKDFRPSEPYDFFSKFRDLLVFMEKWGRFIVIKTPILLGPTQPPWEYIYVYHSKKYRISVWLFDTRPLHHTRAIRPL